VKRFWALALKELRQIRRDRRLMISLIVPPTLQILLFGFALDSNVSHLKLGIVDESQTLESRELIRALTQNSTFTLTGAYPTAGALGQDLGVGRLDVGVIVPHDFTRRQTRGWPIVVQVLLNADFQFLARSQRIARHTSSLEMTPHELVGIQVGRVTRQHMHRELSLGRFDVLAHIGLLVCWQSINDQMHWAVAALHHLLEQFDE